MRSQRLRLVFTVLDGEQGNADENAAGIGGDYERWAADAEALADQIMAGLDTQRKEIQVKQRESAQTFVEEAERFRQVATRLRDPDVYRSLRGNRNKYGQEVHL